MLENNISIAGKIYTKRKHILLVTFTAMILGLTYSFIIKPVYTSVAYIYPANLGLYGQESQTEQLLQFLESDEIRFYLLRKYNLSKHYDVDTTKERYLTTFEDIINSKIKITRTKYESIEIKVNDSDADTAKLLVYGVIDAVNWLIEKEHREKYYEDVQNSKIYLDYKTKDVDSSQHVLNEMNEKHGVLNVGMQVRESVKNQYKLGAGKNTSLADYIAMSEQLKELEKENQNKTLSDLFTEINNYSIQYGRVSSYFGDQVAAWNSAYNDYQKKISEYQRKNTFTVFAARPIKPEVPSWPKRWLVVLLCGLVMFIFASLYFIFIDLYKETHAKITAGK